MRLSTLDSRLSTLDWNCGKLLGHGSPTVKAYLDIETSFLGDITVFGLYAEDRGFVQLVGGGVSDVAVWESLEGIQVICT